MLVSELMLQQTQVARVVPRYRAFLDRFPDPASCAAAPVGAVVEAWAGLGYNRRAVYLHRAATTLVERHGGRLPDRLEDLTALPGIGAYTARAVLAFAFERDHGVVETNVARVLARAVSGRRLACERGPVLCRSAWFLPAGRGRGTRRSSTSVPWSAWPGRRAANSARWPSAGCAPGGAVAARFRIRRTGSAGTSGRQSTFAGSDRQGRGRLVDALLRGPVPLERIAVVAGWPDDPARAARVAAGLVADGLAVRDPGALTLPGTAAAST